MTVWLGDGDVLLLGVVEIIWYVKEEMHGDEKIGPLVEKSHNCKIMEQNQTGTQNAVK